jgi:hypothetical protein
MSVSPIVEEYITRADDEWKFQRSISSLQPVARCHVRDPVIMSAIRTHGKQARHAASRQTTSPKLTCAIALMIGPLPEDVLAELER